MHFNWNDILLLLRLLLDILLVWAVIYAGIRIIRNNNRTIQIVKGLLAVFLVKLTAMVLNLQGANFLLNIFLNWGVILVMIILQPEIRGMLEKMGTTNSLFRSPTPAAQTNHMIDELMTALENMSRSKTGALITLQMNQSMQDYEETGIPMDSDVSSELLETIFQYGTPMHDGAVIIEGNKIATAAAYYPSTSKDLPSKYGARHRAAVGISEVTDSITIVVSEETGAISVANRGQLIQYNPSALRRFLTNRLIPEETPQNTSVLTPVINTVRSYSSQLGRQKNSQNGGHNDDRVKPVEVVDLRNPEGREAKAQKEASDVRQFRADQEAKARKEDQEEAQHARLEPRRPRQIPGHKKPVRPVRKEQNASPVPLTQQTRAAVQKTEISASAFENPLLHPSSQTVQKKDSEADPASTGADSPSDEAAGKVLSRVQNRSEPIAALDQTLDTPVSQPVPSQPSDEAGDGSQPAQSQPSDLAEDGSQSSAAAQTSAEEPAFLNPFLPPEQAKEQLAETLQEEDGSLCAADIFGGTSGSSGGPEKGGS